MTVTPVNYRKQDASPEAIARDVDYALQITDFYLDQIPGGARRLLNKSVLELGPGYSLGTAILLACHGAQVTVADRYLSPWDSDYHGPFCRALLERLGSERTELDPTPVQAMLEADSFEPSITGLHLGSEDLQDVADDAFDIVLSNAVFEHVEDVPAAVGQLARITRQGGVGVHQVDFRDHRDFSRPLEYMTLPEPEFAALFKSVHGECGNRWRPSQMQREWERAGFDVPEFIANMFAEADYLADLKTRIDDAFADMDPTDLETISGCFVLRRRAELNTEYPVETDSPQTLAHSRTRYAFAAHWVTGKRVLDVGCGAGVGTRLLLEAGAKDVVGVDIRPEALQLARQDDPRSDDAYVRHDLNQAMPFRDGEFDLVVALEVLEHVAEQKLLLAEIQRVLSEDGMALISVPNKAFEEFWTELAGEENPYHVHVPDLEEFVELLAPFPWVEFFGQVDVVSTLVLPLDGNEGEVTQGTLNVQAGTSISDRGTVTIIGLCHKRRPNARRVPRPVAYSYGNYQDTFGGAIASNQALARFAETMTHQHFVASNKLRWNVGDGPDDGAAAAGEGEPAQAEQPVVEPSEPQPEPATETQDAQPEQAVAETPDAQPEQAAVQPQELHADEPSPSPADDAAVRSSAAPPIDDDEDLTMEAWEL